MEHEGSTLDSQDLVSGPCPEPVEFQIPCPFSLAWVVQKNLCKFKSHCDIP